jgi:thymidylate synthase
MMPARQLFESEINMPNYLPYEQRKPDSQYRRLLRGVMNYGEVTEVTRQGVGCRTHLWSEKMVFHFSNGFPCVTTRDMSKFWNKGIGELCAFINGVTTADGLREFGADWWGQWTTAEKCAQFGLPAGDIGPASYGGAFRCFPTLNGGSFDQMANLVRQIQELPNDRVHKVTTWMPAENARGEGFTQRNTIAPCHGDLNVRILNGRLHLQMSQRSCDTPVGGPANMVQYAALALMLEHLTGFEAASYTHNIWDAHVYDDQLPNVRKLIRRPSLAFPTVRLNEAGLAVTDIHDFRREHFELTDYHPHPAMNNIPVST